MHIYYTRTLGGDRLSILRKLFHIPTIETNFNLTILLQVVYYVKLVEHDWCSGDNSRYTLSFMCVNCYKYINNYNYLICKC